MPNKKNTQASSPLPYSPAPLWRRLAALLYDSLLVSAIILVVTGLYHALVNNWLLGLKEAPVGFNPWLSSLLVFVVFFFFAHFWGRNGQTLGMQAWRLKIQSTRPKPNNSRFHLTLLQSLLRFVIAIPALGLCGLGLFWMVIDPNKRSWHDRYSETEIVLLPKP